MKPSPEMTKGPRRTAGRLTGEDVLSNDAMEARAPNEERDITGSASFR